MESTSNSCITLPPQSACYPHLPTLPGIHRNGSKSVAIINNISPKDIDGLIMYIQNNPLILQSVSQKCLVEGELPLEAYCRYLFPLCNEDGQLTRISQQQCESLRDNCSTEFSFVSSVRPEYTKYVPECSDTNGSRTNSFNTTVTCHPQFLNICPSICIPSCTGSVFGLPQIHIAHRVIIGIVSVVTLIGGTLFLVLSLIRRKEM